MQDTAERGAPPGPGGDVGRALFAAYCYAFWWLSFAINFYISHATKLFYFSFKNAVGMDVADQARLPLAAISSARCYCSHTHATRLSR